MDRLLTARAVAELLGVRPATVYTWVSNKCIPYQKVGGALRFNPKSIAKWLHATSGRVDVWCVIERLPEHRDYMLDLMDEDKNPGAVTPMPLIRMLSDCAIRRRLHSVAVTLQRRIADGDTPVELTDILREQL